MSNASASHLVVQTETLKSRALFYSGSGRALLFVLALLFATVSVRAEIKIRSLTNVIEGHAVGGVTVDLVGNIYVADFGDTVWKITPEGKRDVFASGFYGASGNAIDRCGEPQVVVTIPILPGLVIRDIPQIDFSVATTS